MDEKIITDPSPPPDPDADGRMATHLAQLDTHFSRFITKAVEEATELAETIARTKAAAREVEIDQRIAMYLNTIDTRIGGILRAAGEAAQSAKSSASDAASSRQSADKVAARVYSPVDDVLAKYVTDVTESPLLDYGDEAEEITKTQPLATIVKRAKRAERHKVMLWVAIVVAIIVTYLIAWGRGKGYLP